MVNYDTPSQYLNFTGTYCRYLSSFGVTWPSNSGCFILGIWILRLASSCRGSPVLWYGSYLSAYLCYILLMCVSVSDRCSVLTYGIDLHWLDYSPVISQCSPLKTLYYDKCSVTYEQTILIKQIRAEQQLSFLAVDLMASKVNLG